MNVIISATVVSAVLCFCLIPVRSSGSLIVVSILYGFFSGGLVSLPSTIYVHMSMKYRGTTGTRVGMGFFVHSIGVVLGGPLCGFLLGGSAYVWVLTGGFLMTFSRVARVESRTFKTKA